MKAALQKRFKENDEQNDDDDKGQVCQLKKGQQRNGDHGQSKEPTLANGDDGVGFVEGAASERGPSFVHLQRNENAEAGC